MEKWKIADDAGGGGGRFCAEGDLLINQGPGIHDPGQARPEVADGRGEDNYQYTIFGIACKNANSIKYYPLSLNMH